MSHVDGVDDGVGYGVRGNSRYGTIGYSKGGWGVLGSSFSNVGVWGSSNLGPGVMADSIRSYAVLGRSESYNDPAVLGSNDRYTGVYGKSHSGTGVYGESHNYTGAVGTSYNSYGVVGYSYNSHGVVGESDSYLGVGVYGWSNSGAGIYGSSNSGYAAFLNGRVYIRGPLEKPAGSFKIDHPLDPANKYLSHSFVESPDMKNIYDGTVVLDDKGEAEIELPDWFGALNKDFRYQLTAIGAPGPNLYIAEDITDDVTNYSNSNSSNNNNSSHFKIAGGTSGMKVSWQVTGIRKDPWASAYRIQVEEDKPAKEQGYYIYPDLYGQPEEKGISHLLFPPEEKEWQEQLVNEKKQPRRSL